MERFRVYCSNKNTSGYTAIMQADEYQIEKDEELGQYMIHIKKKDEELSKLLGHDSFSFIGSLYCDCCQICEWINGKDLKVIGEYEV